MMEKVYKVNLVLCAVLIVVLASLYLSHFTHVILSSSSSSSHHHPRILSRRKVLKQNFRAAMSYAISALSPLITSVYFYSKPVIISVCPTNPSCHRWLISHQLDSLHGRVFFGFVMLAVFYFLFI